MSLSFKSMNEPETGSTLIVDALNLGFRWYHKGQTDFVEDYIATVLSFKKSYKADKVIIACDKGSSSYRKSILESYKQGRKDKHEKDTEEDKQKFADFFEEMERTIAEMRKDPRMLVLRFDKVEADDIAAFLVKHSKDYPFLQKITLISSDKDWDLLINKNVTRFSYVTRKETSLETWDERYTYPLDHHLFVKCLMGDSGDSIEGVPKVGPVRASQLASDWDGDVLELASNLPIAGSHVYIKNLNNFGVEGLIKNLKLMDLLEYCEEAIGPNNCLEIRKALDAI